MRWKKERWFILAVIFLILNAYAVYLLATRTWRGGELRVESFSPGEGLTVDRRGELRWTFSQAVVTEDKIGKRSPEGPVRFDPDTRGDFTWTAPDTLRFRPEPPWRGCTPFIADLERSLTSLSGQPLGRPLRFRFRTEPLKLTGVRQADFASDRRATFRLEFNAPVSPSALADHLRLESPDGRRVDCRIVGGLDSAVHLVRTSPLPVDYCLIKLSEGLQGTSGPLEIEDEVRQKLDVSPHLALVGLEPEIDAFTPGSIRAAFTAPLDIVSASPYLEIRPAVDFTIEPLHSYFDRAYCRISGEFEPASAYTLTFRKGLDSTSGAQLEADVTRTVYFPDRPPALAVGAAGNYLSPRGNLLVPVKTVNVRSLKVKVERIYPNNLVQFAMRESGRYPCYYGDLQEGLSRSLGEAEIPVTAERNQAGETLVDLRPFLHATPAGAFYLTASEEKAGSAGRLIVVSDIGISVKVGRRDLLVWANSLHTLEPVAGAEVKVYSQTNQEILSGTTDEQGIAGFERTEDLPEEDPFLVTVGRGDDVSYLKLSQTAVAEARDPQGRPYLRQGYEAYLFTDRGIYRPGETAQVTSIVRGKGLSCPPSFPVNLRVTGPLGRTERVFSGALDERGVVSFSVPFPEFSLTGRYRFSLAIPGDEKNHLGQAEIFLEEFVPPQIEVKVEADQERAVAEEALAFTVSARHLFGRRASGNPVSAWVELSPQPFRPAGWSDFVFGDQEKPMKPISLDLGGAALDAEGSAIFTVSVPEGLLPPAALQAVFGCTVLETSGRAVAAYRSRAIDVYPLYIGIKLEKNGGLLPAGDPLHFELAAVRPDGTVETGPDSFELALSRVSWSTVLKKDGDGNYSYVSERQLVPVRAQTVKLRDGRASAAAVPPTPGDYLITARDPVTGASTSLAVFAGSPDQQWFARSMETPERIELSLDRESYRPGQTATLVIKAPFPGEGLLTVESDRVLARRVIQLEKNTATVAIPVLDEYRPNAHCVLTVIRPVKVGEEWAGHRAAGSVPLIVAEPERRLTVSISSPETIRPRSRLSLDLTVTDHEGRGRKSEVAVAAVDEGICLLTDFRCPDPYGFFLGRRRLEVDLFDLYSLLMPESEKSAGGTSPAGGDGDLTAAALRRRLNPIRARRFRPVSLWSGTVLTGEDGRTTVEFDVPEFTGELRLMAVAVGRDAFGSGEGSVTVKRPLVVQSSLPRFLAPSDVFLMPVTVFNETGEAGDALIEVEGTGIRVKAAPGTPGAASRRLSLPAGERAEIRFELEAPGKPGLGKVTLRVSLGKEVYAETTEISVRPPSPLQSVSGFGAVEPGDAVEIPLPRGWVEGTARHEFWFSGQPSIKLGGGLEYLLRYPYGCIEQTTSSSFPLLYLSDLAAKTRPGSMGPEEVRHFVQAGIYRILSMQLAPGGFSYWPAERETYEWGSLYATHFLAEAARAGYDVPADRLEAALAYARSLLARSPDNPGDTASRRWRDDMCLKAYACLVLTIAGKPEPGWAARLAEQSELLDPTARLYVWAAEAGGGERLKTRQRLTALTLSPPADPGRELGGCLRSPLKEDALLLSLWLDLDPDNAAVPALVRRLESSNRNGIWHTTQENALILMALGKYCRIAGARQKPFVATVSGIPGEGTATFTEREDFRRSSERPIVSPIVARNQGPGTVYYCWRSEGIPSEGDVRETDERLEVRRRFFDLQGEEIGGAELPQGEMAVIEVTLDAGANTLDNVVLEDLLPAGMEIENAELKTARRISWIEQSETLPRRHSDIRDDRLIVFTGPFTGKKSCYYAARAVTAGSFIYPPVSAACMYDPSVRSISGRTRIEVVTE